MSSNNNINNNNNNNNSSNGNGNNDEYLPETQKTKKRLLDLDEDNPTPADDNDTTEDDVEIQKEDTKGTEYEQSPLMNKSTSTTTSTGNHEEARKNPIMSPMMGGVVIDANPNFEEGSEYFSGRKLISTSDSGSSDLSDSEDMPAKAKNEEITRLQNQLIGTNMKKKKRKIRKKEGRIFELLEKRLGSQALREGFLGSQFISFDWPYELVLVRHGQSEGNEAQARSKRGDLSAYTDEFKKKHSSVYRLTDKGVLQAKIAGKWVRENIAEVFDRYYTSEYVRAMETAALLGLKDANWLTEIQLRERDKGKMDNISWTEKNERFSHDLEMRKRDSFFWAPPNGESIAGVCQRVEHTFITLRRECANKRVVIVAHGEIMWAFRVRLERLSQIRFHQLQSSKDPRDQIHNTSILWYTRVHPKTGEIFPYFRFLRSVCPWKPEYSAPAWMEFERPVYTNQELLESVRTVPRFVNNIDFDPEKELEAINKQSK
ncbi:hypothetical protein DICPUDRAFT_146978 [Dictyostelium purpureum]|uniref:phosphoglycerate mutase (2,3-diphosphoglycerate-dependent) n=1 Tax=Dictyostelium purpureum TaxID=5786 RepID=F0Z7C4_DICPU|nr:uncharacterized protein DICPUDRAFT_146978 [Dictyostelium purpureum]EGC40153.1 hypothetical protein DICPUDRAFT_146978 [Dictyostelium purpureum]|eukprot:XP_003283343.1 hypothetical protein DICPUDRAFT_146978 [Dictyostelium purpureum]